ncbi:ABC transporter permease [Halovivax asiaticus JCM 14624]|uniref:ABC transporter permease n=1 Tax=Halovivax asiaticus JCM 14624 TaxID=1227490 RepID=M0BTT0_9EURY|nr:ABC transporter permease [Halovivax asiaticus]ELZ13813.1 ABC transporter permease [Halovivax asiaticus JCM 14624]
MSLGRLFAKRIALGFVAAWTVLTIVFAAFNLSEDWVLAGIEGQMRWGGASEAEVEARTREYMASRGLDEPLLERYVDWMGRMLTFDWGQSITSGEPVIGLVREGLVRTAAYVVPGITLAIVLGIGFGLYAALRPESRLAGLGIGTAYLAFAVPNFWVGGMLYSLDGTAFDAPPVLFDSILPIVLTATTLLGGYVSYARAHSREYASTQFVKLVKTKGAGPITVARHIVRNAAIPFVSMVFVEALALLVLSVFVIETLFGIDGFGMQLFTAIETRDLPIVLGSTLAIVAVGITGNILQDIAYTALDPRVDTGAR